MSNLSRAVKIIISIWITAALSALPYPIHTRIYYYVINPDTQEPLADSLICNILPEWLPRMRYVFQMSSFLLFILPMGLITSLYVRIGLTLRQSGLVRHTSECADSPGHSQPRRSVLRMLGKYTVDHIKLYDILGCLIIICKTARCTLFECKNIIQLKINLR